MTYQREIQGLRAVAVLAVIANHLDRTWLPGGFLGVDLFFVISGYLITQLLIAEHDGGGRISLFAFYGRRVRRIVPALLVTVLSTGIVGFLVLSDERFDDLCASTLAAIFAYSNVHFWSEVGYFDAAAATKPLLHTWSLGVEEQFYFVWPMALAVLLRLGSRRWTVACVVGLSVVSLLLNVAFVKYGWNEALAADDGFRASFEDATTTIFYWMPFRGFEFGIGAWLSTSAPSGSWLRRPRVADIVCGASLTTIAFALALSSEDDSVPYLHALALAVATALAIHSARFSALGRLLLGNRVAVFVGGLSYALYLVHWPLIVYWDLLGGAQGFLRVAVLGYVMTLSAYALHVLVERPFRSAPFLLQPGAGFWGLARRLFIPTLAVLSGALSVQAAEIEGRVPKDRLSVSGREWHRQQRALYCKRSMKGFPKNIFTCQKNQRAEKTLVVWGDSHAHQVAAGLVDSFPDWNIAIAYTPNCIAHTGFHNLVEEPVPRRLHNKCKTRNYDLLRWAKERKAPVTVLITNRWRNRPAEMAAITNDLVGQLEAAGHRAFVLGDFVSPGTQLAECRAVPDFVLSNQTLRDICKPDLETVAAQLRYSRELAALSRNFIPVQHIQCPKDVCTFVDDHERLTHRDDHHLNFIGSRYEIRRVAPQIRAAIDATQLDHR